MSTSFTLATESLRALDPDRYAATLVLPPRHRPAVQALYAFAAEVAAIRERVSEPAPGEIRLQWWVDALEGSGHGEVRRNPVADALLTVLSERGLPRGPLVRLLAARRFDLYGDPMPDLNQFEGYAGETVSVLYQYAAMILAEDAQVPAADAAGHLGVAEAVAGHLRAFGYNAARGQIFLPLSVFAAHGAGEADILAGRDSDAIRASLKQLAEIGLDHSEKAGAALAAVPRVARPAFAPLPVVRRDLSRAHAAPSGFAAPAPRNRFATLARMTLWALRNG